MANFSSAISLSYSCSLCCFPWIPSKSSSLSVLIFVDMVLNFLVLLRKNLFLVWKVM